MNSTQKEIEDLKKDKKIFLQSIERTYRGSLYIDDLRTHSLIGILVNEYFNTRIEILKKQKKREIEALKRG